MIIRNTYIIKTQFARVRGVPTQFPVLFCLRISRRVMWNRKATNLRFASFHVGYRSHGDA